MYLMAMRVVTDFLEIRMEDEALATEVLQRRKDLQVDESEDQEDAVFDSGPSFVLVGRGTRTTICVRFCVC